VTQASTLGLDLEIGLSADEAQIKAETNRLADLINKGIGEGLSNVEAAVGEVTKALNNLGGRGQTRMENLADTVRDAGHTFRTTEESAERLAEGMKAAEVRARAMRDEFEKAGVQSDLLASYDHQLKELLDAQEHFNNDFERLARDPKALQAFRTNLSGIETVLGRETQLAKSHAKTARDTAERQGRDVLAVKKHEFAQQEALQKAAQSKFTAITQQETTLRNAEIRSSSNQAIQASQRTARVRIELLRFTLRQARIIERSIGRIFRTSAAIISGAFARIEKTVFRIGRIFRRSNNDINDGLRGALLRREKTIDRSFDRQTREIRGSVAQQSRIIQRFQTQASTGLTGAVTGRSGFGALLGGGLAFGGGFLLIDRLRAGFDEAVNLNESLNKTRQIFREASGDIEEFATNSVEQLFITQSAALEAASNFGIFGKAAGLTGSELSKFSIDLTVLATDLASFNNTEVGDATTALSAALRGESEPIRRYGVLLNEATLQQRALELGIIDTIRKLQPFERVLAANAEIFAQTADQQGDAARTADDFANSSKRAKAASVETFAAIAENLIPIAETITNFAFPSLQKLTKFIRAEVGPGLRVLRDGLIGAAAALASLVAAKAAIEVIGFLGTALRAVATPLGLFVTAVAGLGAGINILRRRSASFNAAIGELVSAIRTALGEAIGFVIRQIDRLADLIARTVLPIITRLTRFITENLRVGLEIIANIFSNLVFPAVERFGQLLRNDVIPFVVTLAEVVGGAVLDGLRQIRDLAVSLFETVQPFIQPAIDGFIALGDAILGLFVEGDVSGLLDGVIELAQGIGATFANVGEAAIDALRPQLERVVAFIRNFFSRDRLLTIAEGFLVVVETIGRILGSIISDHRFITALAAIAGAATITALRFIRGFAEGIFNNLPELIDLLDRAFTLALQEAVKAAFSNPRIVIAALTAFLGARAVMGAFRSFGTRGGKNFTRQFHRTIQSQGKLGAAASLTRGLFGGPDALQKAAAQQGEKARKALVGQFRRANRDLARLGAKTVFFPKGGVTERSVRDLLRHLDTTKAEMGEVGANARLMRRRVGEAFGGIKDIAVGSFRSVVTSSQAGSVQATVGWQRFGQAVSDSFLRLKERGISAGQALGTAVVGGFSSVISGQQLGQGNTLLGLSGILGSALFVGSTATVPLGLATAAVGGLTAAFSANRAAAQRNKDEIQEYTNALRGATTAAELLAKGVDAIDLNLAEENDETILFLDSVQFRVEEFAQAVLDGTFGAGDAVEILSRSFGDSADDFIQFVNAVLQGGGTIEDALNAIDSPLILKTDQLVGLQEDAFALQDAFSDTGFEAKVLTEALDFLFDEDRELPIGLAVARALDSIKGLSDEVGRVDFTEAQTTIAASIDAAFADTESRATTVFGQIQDLGGRAFNAISGALIPIGQEVDGAVDGLDLINQTLEILETERRVPLLEDLEEITGRLAEARTASQLARESLTEYLTGDYERTTQSAIDTALLSLTGLQGQVNAVAELEGLDAGLGQARLNQVILGFDKQIAAVINAGFEEAEARGEIFDRASAEEALKPLEDAASSLLRIGVEDGAKGIDQRTFDLITGQIAAAFEDGGLEAGLEFIAETRLEEEQIQAELDAIQAELTLDVDFDPEQVRDRLREVFPGAPIHLFTDALLSGIQGNEGVPQDTFLTSALTGDQITQAQRAADAAAAARAAALASPFSTAADRRDPTVVPEAVVKIENLNINGADAPRTTAHETIKAMEAAGSSGGALAFPTFP
jgi:hypothetical protein